MDIIFILMNTLNYEDSGCWLFYFYYFLNVFISVVKLKSKEGRKGFKPFCICHLLVRAQYVLFVKWHECPDVKQFLFTLCLQGRDLEAQSKEVDRDLLIEIPGSSYAVANANRTDKYKVQELSPKSLCDEAPIIVHNQQRCQEEEDLGDPAEFAYAEKGKSWKVKEGVEKNGGSSLILCSINEDLFCRVYVFWWTFFYMNSLETKKMFIRHALLGAKTGVAVKGNPVFLFLTQFLWWTIREGS